MKRINTYPKGFDILQKISVSLMAFLVMVTFVGANLHALLWQQSAWLVSTVLPAVVVDMTNTEREQLNAPELRRNSTLDQAAKLKAEHMASKEYFSHYSPEGVSPWHWFNEAGYVYAHAGENLAIHFTDSSEVVDAWMNSPTHRANIVNANYTEIGVGTAKGSFDGYDTVYVVQLFGAPAYIPEASIIPESPDTDDNLLELAEITATLNDLTIAVDDLSDTADGVLDTESPEVLADTIVIETTSNQPLASPEPDSIPDRLDDSDTVSTEDIVSNQVPDEINTSVSAESKDVLIVESTIATSSGLAIASISESPSNKAGTTMVSIVTQPNELLQFIYMTLGMIVMALLLFSAAFEARQLHFLQVSYSLGLMVSMGALWYVHSLLTSGAVIA